MSNAETSETITNLEHALLDVWQWRHLYDFGRAIHSIRSDHAIREQRQLQTQISTSLVQSYAYALQLIDDALFGMEVGPVATAALERTCERLQWLTGRGCYEQVFDQLDGMELFNEPPAWQLKVGEHVIDDPTAGDVEGNWGYVEEDLAFYGAKVVAHIQGYLSDRKEPAKSSERIRWNDTASRLAYLFHELEAAGYITPPQRKENGELKPNWSAVARTLHAAFDIRKVNGDPVKLTGLDAALKLEGDVDKLGGKAAFKITPRRG